MPVKSRKQKSKKVKVSARAVVKDVNKKLKKLTKKKVSLSVKIKKTKPKKIKAEKPAVPTREHKEKTKAEKNKPGQGSIFKKTDAVNHEEKAVSYARPKSVVEPVAVEKDKQLIMWSGVIFFMALIIVFWIYNTKQVFNKTRAESNTSFSMTDWQDAADDIGNRMNKLKSDLDKIRNFEDGNDATEATQINSSIDELKEKLLTATNTKSEVMGESEKTQKEIDELKEKLEELENKLNK